jgi:GT2 family glycosyltransferase
VGFLLMKFSQQPRFRGRFFRGHALASLFKTMFIRQATVNAPQDTATTTRIKSPQSLVQRSFAYTKRSVKRWRRVLQWYRQGGVALLKTCLLHGPTYSSWVALYDTPSVRDRRLLAKRISEMPTKPRISVILTLGLAPYPHLSETVRSIQKQLYTEWELLIATDDPNAHTSSSLLTEHHRSDPRIRVHLNTSPNQAERANSAASAASGEILLIVPEDYQLNEHTLFTIATAALTHPDAQLFYGDEDSIDAEGARHSPRFKPAWDHELMLGTNYIGRAFAVRRTLFQLVGGFREEALPYHEWDLLLRLSESSAASAIHHTPHILTHRMNGDVSRSESTTPCVQQNCRFIEEHLARLGIADASAHQLAKSDRYHIRLKLTPSEPKVSLIIPTRNHLPLLSTCITGILKGTDYQNLELIVVDNGSDEPQTLEYLHSLSSTTNVTVIRDEGEFNFARINNHAAHHASGEILGFINNDIEICKPSWLRSMVAAFMHRNVAAVGARLLYPDNTIQHMGVTLGIGGVADHLYKFQPQHFEGPLGELTVIRNVSAVTAACMLVKKSIFDSLGGFDATSLAVAYNDVDLCLRIKEAGHLIVCTPEAELVHHESKSRGYEDSPEKLRRFQAEYKTMQRRWGTKLAHDPFYSPNLSLFTPHGELAFPPRTSKPWA